MYNIIQGFVPNMKTFPQTYMLLRDLYLEKQAFHMNYTETLQEPIHFHM